MSHRGFTIGAATRASLATALTVGLAALFVLAANTAAGAETRTPNSSVRCGIALVESDGGLFLSFDRSSPEFRAAGVDYLVWRNGHVVLRVPSLRVGDGGGSNRVETFAVGSGTNHFSISRAFADAPADRATRVYCGAVAGPDTPNLEQCSARALGAAGAVELSIVPADSDGETELEFLIWRNGRVISRVADSSGISNITSEAVGANTNYFSVSRELVGARPDPARRVYCGSLPGPVGNVASNVEFCTLKHVRIDGLIEANGDVFDLLVDFDESEERFRASDVDYLLWRNGQLIDRQNAASVDVSGERLSIATETAGSARQHFSMSRELVGAPADATRRVYCGNVIGVGFYDR